MRVDGRVCGTVRRVGGRSDPSGPRPTHVGLGPDVQGVVIHTIPTCSLRKKRRFCLIAPQHAESVWRFHALPGLFASCGTLSTLLAQPQIPYSFTPPATAPPTK